MVQGRRTTFQAALGGSCVLIISHDYSKVCYRGRRGRDVPWKQAIWAPRVSSSPSTLRFSIEENLLWSVARYAIGQIISQDSSRMIVQTCPQDILPASAVDSQLVEEERTTFQVRILIAIASSKLSMSRCANICNFSLPEHAPRARSPDCDICVSTRAVYEDKSEVT